MPAMRPGVPARGAMAHREFATSWPDADTPRSTDWLDW